ncbi:PREDICTED: uncharacterized protein LOC107328849 [Acropora digitifera]|uniref:uncharacterized protein LOC107328849 n=1 Tax=Acropora digitifera TaxID=70779 RepID=UPI00077AF053|nr:PREDICTED: uncharacterized protein LOC107328849 [Acropora digitifera]
MARQFWLEVLVVVSLVLGSRGSRKDSGTKPLDDLLEKIADGLAKNDKCKNIKSESLSGCTITEDCLELTCSKTLIKKEISLKMKVNRCDEPVTVTIDVKVKKENVEWSHVFTSSDEVQVPGLTFSVAGLAKADLYVKVKLLDEDGKFTFKIGLAAKTKLGPIKLPLASFNVASEPLPITREYCGLVRWWFDKNTAVRISVTITFLLVALFVITFGCFGGFCRGKPCKKRINLVI